jgi:hypothetical protein
MDILLRDPKFWAAVVLIVKIILFYAVPTFPEQLWAAIDALLAVVIGALAGVTARQQVLTRRILRGVR